MKQREQRAFLVLCLILGGITFYRYLPSPAAPMHEIHWASFQEIQPKPFLPSKPHSTQEKRKTRVKAKKRPYIIDINTAKIADWEQLPGIGKKRAKSILDFRDKLRFFVSDSALLQCYGIDSIVFQTIQPYVRVATTDTQRPYLNLKKDSYKTLIRHPYLKKDQVRFIVKGRKLFPQFGFEDLRLSSTFTNQDLNRLRPYVIGR